MMFRVIRLPITAAVFNASADEYRQGVLVGARAAREGDRLRILSSDGIVLHED